MLRSPGNLNGEELQDDGKSLSFHSHKREVNFWELVCFHHVLFGERFGTASSCKLEGAVFCCTRFP